MKNEISVFAPKENGLLKFLMSFYFFLEYYSSQSDNFCIVASGECREYEKNQNSALHVVEKEIEPVFIVLLLLPQVLFVVEQRIFRCCAPESAVSMRKIKILPYI